MVNNAVESSAMIIRGELKSMKNSFDSQLKSISEKETRHHPETSLIIKEFAENRPHKMTQDKLNELENSQRSLATKPHVRNRIYGIPRSTKSRLIWPGTMARNKFDKMPADLSTMGDEILAKKAHLEELVARAEKMIENIKDKSTNTEEKMY